MAGILDASISSAENKHGDFPLRGDTGTADGEDTTLGSIACQAAPSRAPASRHNPSPIYRREIMEAGLGNRLCRALTTRALHAVFTRSSCRSAVELSRSLAASHETARATAEPRSGCRTPAEFTGTRRPGKLSRFKPSRWRGQAANLSRLSFRPFTHRSFV